MQITATALPEIKLYTPTVYRDHRGLFCELFRDETLRAAGIEAPLIQENLSVSGRGVLRGLHYQLPQPQGKLVTVVAGAVFDVAVDMRRHSPRWGQWVGVRLTADSRQQLWVPGGFAHGFLTLTESSTVLYRVNAYRCVEAERVLLWSDAHVAIDWPLGEAGVAEPVVSPRDAAGVPWASAPMYDTPAFATTPDPREGQSTP